MEPDEPEDDDEKELNEPDVPEDDENFDEEPTSNDNTPNEDDCDSDSEGEHDELTEVISAKYDALLAENEALKSMLTSMQSTLL